MIVNTGMILNLWATSLGPISLVSALTGSSSLFLLVYSTLLGLAFPRVAREQVGRRAVIVKASATTLRVMVISLG